MAHYANNVTLRGVIGNIKIDAEVARFTLATNSAYKDNDGGWIVETTWHNVTARNGEFTSIDGLAKGQAVEVDGRIRTQRYIKADGTETYMTEIVARSIRHIDGNLEFEML